MARKQDRVARSLPHLIKIMDQLNTGGIAFQSLSKEINASTLGAAFYAAQDHLS